MAKPKSKKASNGNVSGVEGASLTPAVESANGTVSGESFSVRAADAVETEKKSAVRRAVRKPEIVKTEPRSNLFPINLEDEIRRMAYLLSERRGFEPGHETEDWLSAEHEVLQRYQHQQPATA